MTGGPGTLRYRVHSLAAGKGLPGEWPLVTEHDTLAESDAEKARRIASGNERMVWQSVFEPDDCGERLLWQECPDNEPKRRYRFRYRPARGGMVQECYAGPDRLDAERMAGWLHAWGDRILPPAASYADPCAPRCRLCGAPFGEDLDGGEVPRQSLKNAGYLAERGPDGAIPADACERCATGAFEAEEKDVP